MHLRRSVVPLALIAMLLVSACASDQSEEIRPSSPARTYDVPEGSHPHDVAPATDGGVWFTGQRAGFLGHFDPSTQIVEQVPLGDGSAPHGVIVGPDGAAWVTDGGLNAIVRVDSTTHQVRSYRLPVGREGANLNTATFDSDGALWFTGQAGVYGQLDPATGTMTVYDAPRGAGPYGIATTPRGEVYYASLAGNYVGRIDTTTGKTTVLEPPTPQQGARRVWSARTAAEIQAKQGHDLIQYIATFSQFEPSVIDLNDIVQEAEKRHGKMLDVVRKSSFNPNTNKYYAYSPAWAPDPGDYRKSMWEKVGLPNGPSTWDELLEGGAEIKKSQGVQMGIGMSQEIDSNMAGRALMWSFGGSIQDENEKVVINSPETVAAVEFMTRLYKESMTPEVFSWNAASNNQGLVAGQMSYILNSISAWRTAQSENPSVADDISFVKALQGPKTALVAQHVMYNWIVPSFSPNVDAAKEFLLHYTANLPSVTYQSKLYDFPAFPDAVPDLDGWLDKDPFGANPPDKLAILKDSTDWCTNIGHPGPASPAIGEVLYTFVIPNMYAKAARGELSPQQSVAEAEKQINSIFQNWRSRGLVAG